MSWANIGWVLLLLACSCEHRALQNTPAPPSAFAALPPPSASAALPTAVSAAARLPEDPEAGARSVAQWRDHLAEEERERRLRYDRRKLPEHRKLVRLLRATQGEYDRATTAAAITNAEASFRASLPQLEKRLDAIDHYQESSRLLVEYGKLIDLFENKYPNARRAALTGSTAAQAEVTSGTEAIFTTIDAWLKEASQEGRD